MTTERFAERRNFQHYFQPIFNLWGWKRKGYEVFIRSDVDPGHGAMSRTDELLRRDEFNLNYAQLQKTIRLYRAASLSKKSKLLFLNLSATTLSYRSFLPFIEDATSDLQRSHIVLEISKSEKMDSFDLLKKRVIELKERGFLIAIDHVGEGYSNFKTMIELQPHFLKLDRYFAKDLYASKQKQTLITLLLSYCAQQKCDLILEGIEREIDLAVAKTLGVRYGQGSIIGKPALWRETVC